MQYRRRSRVHVSQTPDILYTHVGSEPIPIRLYVERTPDWFRECFTIADCVDRDVSSRTGGREIVLWRTSCHLSGHTDVTPMNRISWSRAVASASALVAAMLQWIGLPVDEDKKERQENRQK